MATVDPMRYAFLAITAAAALTVAACGSSGNSTSAASKSPTNPTSSSPAAAQASTDHVAGMIASVSGNTVQVNQKNGSATVDLTASTKVAEMTPAQPTDLTPGICVTARTPKGNPSTAARVVVIGAGTDGSCAPPKNPRPGMVRGTVASVNAGTVVVDVNQNGATAPMNVTVDATTTYKKRASATPQAVAQGMCLAARGTKGSSGALQATNVIVAPATDGKCFGPGR
jgi:hypothetical protein